MNAFGRLMVRMGATPPPDSDYWYSPVQPTYGSYLSQLADTESALRVSAVFACVDLRARTIGTLPFQVFRREANGNREVDRDHPLYRIVHDSPNDYQTAFEFWSGVERDLCLEGNSYAHIVVNGKDEVIALHPLDPTKITPRRDIETNVMVFEKREGGKVEYIPYSDVLHIPGLGYDGVRNLTGMSPARYMARAIDLAANAEAMGGNFFRNNGTPPAYIAHPRALKAETKNNIVQYLLENFGGVRNAGKMAILEEGMEIKTVPLKYTEMQFIEARQFQIPEICRIFGVPPHMIFDLTRSTNNNIEHQDLGWVKHMIAPTATRIRARVNMQLFGPRESQRWYCDFNLNTLMRGDHASRAMFYSTLRNTGVLNANEIRTMENLNQYEGGDAYMVQGAMVPVEMAGQQNQGVAQ